MLALLLVDSPVSKMLKDFGVSEKDLRTAIMDLRGGKA
jgi:DNA-binding transcriptional regulator PaaX